jgi:hypothetical protein
VLGDPAHEGTRKPEEKMMFVELNVVGYRFSREVPGRWGLSRNSFRSPPRAINWRMPHLRHSNAA